LSPKYFNFPPEGLTHAKSYFSLFLKTLTIFFNSFGLKNRAEKEDVRETFKEVWKSMELSRVIKNIQKSLESE
jgi:hypothetical protein